MNNINNISIRDQSQRLQALDISQSFIVQAPAGSGKTSLLVQRYLALLSTVQNPEEIIAITFTRKAATEMRDRIIAALTRATKDKNNVSSHEIRIHKLAQQVLAQNTKNQWNLLENPKRLRIQTIDSLCAYLSRQLPLLSGFNAYEDIAEGYQATNYYQKAAHNTISQNLGQADLGPALKEFLLHLGNDLKKAEKLLAEMLAHREQWLPYILQDFSRETLEQGLKNIHQEILEKVAKIFPCEYLPKIKELLWFAGNNLKSAKKNNFISQLIDFKDFFSEINLLPNYSAAFFHALTELLLTDEGNYRKRFDVNLGFPPKNTPDATKAEKELFASMKAQIQVLIQDLSAHPQGEVLREILQELTQTPKENYTEEEWQVICALLRILPNLAAQLTILFAETSNADYTEIAMAADRALGNSSNNKPSDLALALDYQIKHLLIDEFQDTSIAQFRLIEKLTAGWQQDDSRTLFLVGDPMQSIYRFRQAEVGLFLQARQYGIGTIKLTPLTLQTNFRASAKLIDWLNTNFNKILPPISDSTYGAVNFTQALAAPNTNPEAKPEKAIHDVKIQIFQNNVNFTKPDDTNTDTTNDNSQDKEKNTANDLLEAQQILSLIQQFKINYPNDTIAVLGRTRAHLTPIITQLDKAKIAYQAEEFKPLSKSPVIIDLFALTAAITNFADKISWIAILRAPWCGLKLQDLLIIANGKKKTVWENIHETSIREQLSDDANIRLNSFIAIIQTGLKNQRLLDLKTNVCNLWLALKGPACVSNNEELQNAKQYFKVLAKFATQNLNTSNLKLLRKALDSLYASSSGDATLQIMTIHKAKGLEFDHVIVPSLNKYTKKNSDQVLMWLERPRTHSGSDLLIAPIKSDNSATEAETNNSKKTNSIFNYLKLCDQKKSYYELGRLLYVAITRAKKSVYLSGHINNDAEHKIKPPNNESLLHQLWPCFHESWLSENSLENATINQPQKEKTVNQLKLHRLINLDNDAAAEQSTTTNEETAKPLVFRFTPNDSNAQLGTVIHKALADLACDDNLNINPKTYISTSKTAYWKRLLLELGYFNNITAGLEKIATAVTNTLTDPRGRWIIDNNHQDAHSELTITTVINSDSNNHIESSTQNLIIDRTFVEDNVHWIIDYKTSTPKAFDNITVKQFLEEQQQLHHAQLQNYATALSKFKPRHQLIKLGLYFPLCKLWIEY